MLISSVLVLFVQSPSFSNLVPAGFGYLVEVLVNGKKKLAGINLGNGSSFMTREEYEAGEIGEGAECTVQLSDPGIYLNKVKFYRSTRIKAGAKKTDGYDLVLGADAFRDKVVVWDIPKQRISISEVSVPNRYDIPFSPKDLTFKVSGQKFALPVIYKFCTRPFHIGVIKGFKRSDPRTMAQSSIDTGFYTDLCDRLRLTGIVENSDVNSESPGESFFGFQVVEVDFKSNSIRFDQNYVFNFVYFLRTETNQDIRFENGKFMFYKATAEIPKSNSDHWGVESAEVVEIGGIDLRDAFSERIEGARKILESLWYREPSFLLKTNGETKKYLLKNFGS